MKESIEQALRLKSRARTAREEGDPERATKLIEDACRRLDALWDERKAIIDEAREDARPDDRDLVDALAEMHGVRGGIYRARGMFEQAAKAYDQGFHFEGHAARKADSSYDLVQRLTNRAMLHPEWIGRDAWHVLNEDMWATLGNAEATLRGQLGGSRANDPWAVADLLFIQLLLASKPGGDGRAIEDAWSVLESLKPKYFVYESTRRALEDLRNEMEKVPEDTRSDGWRRVERWLDELIPRFREGERRVRGN